MIRMIRNSICMVLLMSVLLGLIYPLAMTGFAGIVFPKQAHGSLVTSTKGGTVGSALIGQRFTKPEYFHGRPSAAGAEGYDALASSGSNLGPTSKKIADTVKSRMEAVRSENALASDTPVPSDLVMASASGLDPHISVASALIQVNRVAKFRALPVENVRKLVETHTESPVLGFLGQEKVNVLELNMALDDMVK